MKRLLTAALSVFFIAYGIPLGLSASESSKVIDRHGSKTYIGTSSDWSSRWKSENFEDVTGEDVSVGGNLTIKGGNVGAVDVSGDDSTLTVTGGTMGSVSCDSDVSLSGGTIGGSVTSGSGTLEISGAVSISGNIKCDDLTVSGDSRQNIAGDISCLYQAYINGAGLKCKGLSCDSLRLENYRGTLGGVEASELLLGSNCSVKASGDLDVLNLSVSSGSALRASGTVEADAVNGPGSLTVVHGKLTVHSSAGNGLELYFSSDPTPGSAVFSSSKQLSTGAVTVYGYTLACRQGTGGGYEYTAQKQSGSGVSISQDSIALSDLDPKILRASVCPGLSQLPAGTKLCWVLSDPALFTYSLSAHDTECSVRYNGSASDTTASAFVSCYLAKSNGDPLGGYRNDVCGVTYSRAATILDTARVDIPLGCTYRVLDKSAGSSSDACWSGDSGVVTTGASEKSAGGWLYPLTAAGRGTAAVTIGNACVTVSVTHACGIVDTSSVTIGVGQTYTIGVALHGIGAQDLRVSSTGHAASVAYKGTVGGTALYTVKGAGTGSADIIFTGAAGSARTAVTVRRNRGLSGVGGRLKVLV